MENIYKMTIITTDGKILKAESSLTTDPVNSAEEHMDTWLLTMAANGYDALNADVQDADGGMTVNVKNEEGSTISLIIVWILSQMMNIS